MLQFIFILLNLETLTMNHTNAFLMLSFLLWHEMNSFHFCYIKFFNLAGTELDLIKWILWVYVKVDYFIYSVCTRFTGFFFSFRLDQVSFLYICQLK